MKPQAAIRRATQRAQNAMRELDAQAVDELLRVYRAAAEEVRQRIAASLDSTDSVPLQNLRRLLAEIETILDGLAQQRDGILTTAIERAAELGVEPFTLQGIVRVGGSQAVIDSGAASRISQNAVRFVQTFTGADGLTLSDRLWRVDRGAKEALTRSIEQAVVQGLSGTRAATEFMMRGEPVPADVAQRVAQAKGGPLGLLAGELARRDTGALYQAERVMRTEINRAHGEAFFAAGEDTPGRAGWRYLLSPLHPAPDICDLLSTQNLHGLGPGVYPTREATPWPAHPNTLSFIQMVFEDEVSDADRAGKETPLQALARLTPEQRAGAVGVTKAEYFDRGLLRAGMIRSSTAAVTERLQRQGSIPRLP